MAVVVKIGELWVEGNEGANSGNGEVVVVVVVVVVTAVE